MKFLRFLLILLGLLLLAVVVLYFIGPKTTTVSESVVIDAPANVVYKHMNTLEAQNVWSPWMKEDPNADGKYEGAPGTVGASHSWKSDIIGEGKQTIEEVMPGKGMKTKLEFVKPFSGLAEATMTHEAMGPNQTKVTWDFFSENNFIFRVMGAFADSGEMISKSYNQGLNELKSIVETKAKGLINGYQINEINFPGYQTVGKKATMSIGDGTKMQAFYADALGSAMELITKNGTTPAGAPMGVYFTWDMEKGETEMAGVIPTAKAVSAPTGMVNIELPRTKGYSIDYFGNYEGLGAAHEALDMFLKKNSVPEEKLIAIEEYITDPMQEPDTSKWLTRITYINYEK